MAGVGKSYLVNSVMDALTTNGWIYLGCKFDRLMRNQPLVTIASAVENFIQQLSHVRELPGGFDVDAVIASVEQSSLSASGIVVLSELVTGLRVLYRDIFSHVIIDDSEDELNHIEAETTPDDNNDELTYEDGISSANTLRNRLHYLFGRLIGAISSVAHPYFYSWTIFNGQIRLASSCCRVCLLVVLSLPHRGLDRMIENFGSFSQGVIGLVSNGRVPSTLAPSFRSHEPTKSMQQRRLAASIDMMPI